MEVIKIINERFERNECIKYLNRRIGVGVRHIIDNERLFFYYGHLIEVYDCELKLKLPNGIKIIPFSEIFEIRLAEGC